MATNSKISHKIFIKQSDRKTVLIPCKSIL